MAVPKGPNVADLTRAVRQLQSVVLNLNTSGAFLPLYFAKNFGVLWDGSTDDSTALNNLITNVHSAGGGLIMLPSGTGVIGTTLTFANNGVAMVGPGPGACTINYTGTGNAISVTASGLVHLEGFLLDGSSAATTSNGIVQNYAASTTSNRHSLSHLQVRNFGNDGVQLLNIEDFEANDVWSQSNGRYGFYLDNTGNTSSGPGISNIFRRCRSASNGGVNGWQVQHQQGTEFVSCQALGNGTGASTDVQFNVAGGCRGLHITKLDVENGGNSSAGRGLSIAGSEHTVSVSAANLDVGIIVAASSCAVLPGKYSSVTTLISMNTGVKANVIFLNDNNGAFTNNSGNGTNIVLAQDHVRVPQCTTATRPSASTVGYGAMVYESTLHYPIYSDGTNWRDGAGNFV